MSQSKPYLEFLSRKYPRKRAFITGGGSGLGLAFALDLARAGWTIGITDLNEVTLASAAKTIQDSGGIALSYVFDVSDYEKFKEAVSDFNQHHGGIDIGINNAGIGCGGLIHELPIETFRKVIDVNLMGVVNGCHLFVPIMRSQKSGHILNIASAAAFVNAPRMSAYSTSKAGVMALSENLRAELLDEGVLVSVLAPTYVRTNIGKDTLGPEYENRLSQLFVEDSQVTAEAAAEETLKRMSAGALYVVLPGEAVFLWNFKRLFPERFWRFIAKAAKRRIAEVEKKAKT